MALAQIHYRGRTDSAGLNSEDFDYSVDSTWLQETDRTFRVRFEVEGTGTVGGQLEASLNGGGYFNVTTTSGTVTAALSDEFSDDDLTYDLIGGSELDWVTGSGSTRGAATAVPLANEQTELEYAVRVSEAGTVSLRVKELDTYAQTPEVYALDLSERQRVRLKVGDVDGTLLTDAQVDAYVAAWPGNPDLAAADAAEAIAGKFSRDFNFSEDGQSFNRRERVLHYMALSESLRKRGGALEWPKS